MTDQQIKAIMEEIGFKSDRAYGNIVLNENTIKKILLKHLSNSEKGVEIENDCKHKFATLKPGYTETTRCIKCGLNPLNKEKLCLRCGLPKSVVKKEGSGGCSSRGYYYPKHLWK